jgi:hypothetical protein
MRRYWCSSALRVRRPTLNGGILVWARLLGDIGTFVH